VMISTLEFGDDARHDGCDGCDGWSESTWAGTSCDLTDPARLYFSTLESWVRLFAKSGFKSCELQGAAASWNREICLGDIYCLTLDASPTHSSGALPNG